MLPTTGLLNDKQITQLCEEEAMISPFERDLVRRNPQGEKVISYGLSSYGYDLRVAHEFRVFTNVNSTVVDPKEFDETSFVTVKGDSCIIPPNSFALAHSMEYFRIPADVLAVCVGKSTYARLGVVTPVTPFEPGWHGEVTLEICNASPLPARIYAGEGLCQVLFFRGEPCRTDYAARSGKYLGQRGVTLARP